MTPFAAQTATYKKTGHHTGGPQASAFLAKWLETNKIVEHNVGRTGQDYNTRLTDATVALRFAFHPFSIHTGLTASLPYDSDHFTIVELVCGYQPYIIPQRSVLLRMANRSQFSGSSWIVDSYAVLQEITGMGVYPMVVNKHQ